PNEAGSSRGGRLKSALPAALTIHERTHIFGERTHKFAMATKKAAAKTTTKKAPAVKKQAAIRTPPSHRAQDKEEIRKRIVTAALSLFQTKGFESTTTRAIARKAKIAEGTVFNYFRTKEDIALHFFELEVDHAIAAVRDNPRLKKAPLEEKLFSLVH